VRLRSLGAALALLVVGSVLTAPAQARSAVVGTSAHGRPIVAIRVGNPRAPRKVLVVGVIHGNERAGLAVTRRLHHAHPPRGVELWLVDSVNPDGAAAGTRQNARGVDLNRNFAVGWRGGGRPFDTFYPGPRPFSEPESRTVRDLTLRIRPRVTIWYHQHLNLVTKRTGGDVRLEAVYAHRARMRHRRLAALSGTATAWQNRTVRDGTAFTVELPGGSLSRTGVRRHARAVLAVAGAIAPPPLVRRPIPFGDRRKREMRAYARRHYGIDSFHLDHPHVIVEHYTATNSFGSAFSTFASDSPDPELHELPGVCAHYIVARNGRIYQLVSTRLMCRHTVGLNWTAIGIEHVGMSDGQVLHDRRQIRASLRLTRHLQGVYGIRTRHVIGHNESLSSPYHRENVAALRHQTHGDFNRASMRRYRRALRRLPAPDSVR
jgi:N-acetylmuramoyl-L-alanine amidase-like protein/zinc carboxypeptidase